MDREFFDDGIGVVPPTIINVDGVIRRQRRVRRFHRIGSGVVAAVAVTALVATAHLVLAGTGASVTPMNAASSTSGADLAAFSNSVDVLQADIIAALPGATVTLKAIPVTPVGYSHPEKLYTVSGFIKTDSGGTAQVMMSMSRPAADPSVGKGAGTYGAGNVHGDGTEVTIKVVPTGNSKPPLTVAQMEHIVADPALTLASS